MALHTLAERSIPGSVPVLVFALVAALVLVVPPVAAGPLSLAEAYLVTVAILLLAVLHGAPYAAVVVVGTLPLVLRTGSAGYASPDVAVGDASTTAVAVRHALVGVGYVLTSACVGSVLVGAELAGLALPRGAVVPTGAILGGLVTGGAFVALQRWRYRTLGVALDWRATATTAGLGVLLALSPAVTYWRFGGRLGGL